ncbi:MAG TPA: hypothetical protein VE967_16305, partial [Gemmatimonadaceae bacterium]|nr:hypothetical protein [Gemmatimonadaceae bacterium]
MTGALRSIAFTLLAAVAGAVLLVPSRPTDETVRVRSVFSDLHDAETRYELQTELFMRAASLAVARDAVQRAGQARGLVVVSEPGIPATYLGELNDAVRQIDRALRAHDSSARVIIAAALGAPRSDRFSITPRTTLAPADREQFFSAGDAYAPEATDGKSCVVVLSVSPSWKRAISRDDVLRHLEPCLWYAAYGIPGRGVSAWLDSTNYAPLM